MATCAGCHTELPPTKPSPLTGVVAVPRMWCSERCRRCNLYSGRCVDCGDPTDGSNGRAKAPKRCAACRVKWQHENATWTKDRLIAEARRWQELTGSWPSSTAWHTTCGAKPSEAFRSAVFEFRELTGPWPAASTPTRLFGSWAEFMAAASGEPPGHGARGVKNGQRVAEMRAAIASLQASRVHGDG